MTRSDSTPKQVRFSRTRPKVVTCKACLEALDFILFFPQYTGFGTLIRRAVARGGHFHVVA